MKSIGDKLAELVIELNISPFSDRGQTLIARGLAKYWIGYKWKSIDGFIRSQAEGR